MAPAHQSLRGNKAYEKKMVPGGGVTVVVNGRGDICE